MILGPAVSIIVPTRDALAWLPGAIESIGMDPNVEILVVDDGSTDGTLAWLGEQARIDSRLRFMHGTHAGPSRARNLAVGAARAPLVAFLQPGDRWLPGKLQAQIDLHANQPHVGFSFTDYRLLTSAGLPNGTGFAAWPRFSAQYGRAEAPFVMDRPLSALYAEAIVSTSTVVARTALLREVGGFSTGLYTAEDWDLWLLLARKVPVAVVPCVLADQYDERSGGLTAGPDLRVMAMTLIAERHRDAALSQDPSAEPAFQARLSAAKADAAMAAGHRLEALIQRVRAFGHQPTSTTARAAAGAFRRLIG